jgi:soluble lytic murein transglycosylase
VRRLRSLVTWLLLFALATGVVFGIRWLSTVIYPLPYRQILFMRAQEQGLDPYLVAALIRRESSFRPNAVSAQGARGLMQIMPDTGEWVAQQMNIPYSPEKLFIPDYNMQLGCWYLALLRAQFAGDDVLALAAYNSGRQNVQTWLNERQWTGEHQTLDQIPFPETRAYVANVLGDLTWYRRIYAD